MIHHLRLHRSSRERVVIAFISLALIFAGVGLLAVLPACSQSGTPAAKGSAAASYTVRGKIESLPAGDTDLTIQHEPIPTFKDKDGTTVGMGTMSMPFPLAQGVSVEGLAEGDVVEFEFSVWLQPRVAYEVTRIKKLPADTTLNFGPASGGADHDGH